ncbi:LrgB family protein [Aestuariibius sp. 2305UL40-4]|uniref:LrgB family protein n=1 Tax=Aestuariibius violaceus TaxID=3234132 RepID=UPI00345EE38D
MTEVAELWSYLSASPLTWLTATLLAYLLADGGARKLGNPPWANPVLFSVLLIAPVLWVSNTDYATYFEGAQFIHFLLGPATVALALPLWDNRDTIRRSLAPIALALFAGSVVAAGSAILLAQAFGLPEDILLSLAPKSTTAPVALGISEAIGGIPTLTAVLVILTGIIGAMTVTPMMNLMRISDWRARGFSVGVAAHGIGTARAFQVNPVAGAYAGIAMALNALLTSLIVPILVRWWV